MLISILLQSMGRQPSLLVAATDFNYLCDTLEARSTRPDDHFLIHVCRLSWISGKVNEVLGRASDCLEVDIKYLVTLVKGFDAEIMAWAARPTPKCQCHFSRFA